MKPERTRPAALVVALNTSAEQAERLRALQATFAQACNALAPVVRDTRCWNRVALHHMAYRTLRAQFPQLGSQMACNAIYSVSRTCRLVFQHPGSPFHLSRLGERPLPLLAFAPSAPVYFDRHTLNLRGGRLSMYTLDGRIHFALDISPDDQQRFHDEKLREIVLASPGDRFQLTFHFGAAEPGPDEEPRAAATTADPPPGTPAAALPAEFPEYVLIHDAPVGDPA